MKLPEAIGRLAGELEELPGIGPRQAIRLAFYLVGRGVNAGKNLAQAVEGLNSLKICERCFFVHQNKDSLCNICRSKERRQEIIAIVEKETDLISLENAKKFNGRYLVLGEIPKSGMLEDSQKLRLENLKGFIKKELGGSANEIVLAFNPGTIGDLHASIISKELAGFAKKISRLGRGLPTGGEIEFADDETLGSALELRG